MQSLLPLILPVALTAKPDPRIGAQNASRSPNYRRGLSTFTIVSPPVLSMTTVLDTSTVAPNDVDSYFGLSLYTCKYIEYTHSTLNYSPSCSPAPAVVIPTSRVRIAIWLSWGSLPEEQALPYTTKAPRSSRLSTWAVKGLLYSWCALCIPEGPSIQSQVIYPKL